MEYIHYDEQFWQPEVLKKKEPSVDTVRKYGHLAFIANRGYKEDALPEDHPINIKLRTCKSDNDYLHLKLTAAEASWLICYSLNDEMVMTLVSGNDFIKSIAYDVISNAAINNSFHYENEVEDLKALRIYKEPSYYFSHDDVTIMDIALKMDELLLKEWDKLSQKK